MKRMIAMVLACLLLTAGGALAEMGVQMIGGPVIEAEQASLDDMQIGAVAEIEGYGLLEITKCERLDVLPAFNAVGSHKQYDSGKEAEYAVVRMDITNTALNEKDYLAQCEVKVVFDEVYEYAGWSYQVDYDKSEERVLYEDDFFPIGPLYEGHFVFGCTLPNAVVESDAPLQMIITMDGHEITYNIRK